MTAQFEDYVLGNTSEEYQRLRMQALAWEEATRRALGKVGLAAGARCLDVGCGPGEVMRLLREIVGSAGHVTGVDRDGKIGAEALATLSAVYGGNIAFHHLDLTSAALIPGAPYDLVFGRFVAFHQKDPVALLRRLWDVTKPGGTLLMMDADIVAPMSVWPAWSKPICEFVHNTMKAVGLDLETGRHMPEYFISAGIGVPDGFDASTLLFRGPEVAEFAITVANSLLPAAKQIGTTTDADFAAMVGRTRAGGASEQGWLYWPIAIATWKRKVAP